MRPQGLRKQRGAIRINEFVPFKRQTDAACYVRIQRSIIFSIWIRECKIRTNHYTPLWDGTFLFKFIHKENHISIFLLVIGQFFPSILEHFGVKRFCNVAANNLKCQCFRVSWRVSSLKGSKRESAYMYLIVRQICLHFVFWRCVWSLFGFEEQSHVSRIFARV